MVIIVLFLHDSLRLGADFLVWSADSQRIHAVLEHSAADSQQVGGMGLNIVCSLEGIENNFPFEFHDSFFEG